MSVKRTCRRVAAEMEAEAENISPLEGIARGEAHPAPMLRRWAKRLKRAADAKDRGGRDEATDPGL